MKWLILALSRLGSFGWPLDVTSINNSSGIHYVGFNVCVRVCVYLCSFVCISLFVFARARVCMLACVCHISPVGPLYSS